MSRLVAADLFCGAGGTSTGLLKAARRLKLKVDLVAINHWDVAIATHSLNHPEVTHFNSDLEKIDPRQVVPGGTLDLLVASPECTHFSKARGGKPMSKQSRASVKYILRWVSVLDVKNVIIENVPEFMDWGPLHRQGPDKDKPIKNRKGEYFHRFVRKMEEHGYTVRWRVLNAADYGDPTTRKRLFVLARKGAAPVFPEPTHSKQAVDLFGTRKTWRPAREIIDWTLKGESIFKRKRPLSPNTMRRIMAGLMKFGGKAFVLGQQSGSAPREIDQPLPTVAGAGAISFIEPFIIPQFSSAAPRSVDDPLSTITSTSRGIGLVEPFIMPVNHGKDDQRAYSLDNPMPTVTSVDAWSLIEPYLIPFHGEHKKQKPRSHSVDDPLPTVHAGGVGFGLAEPYLVEYYGTGGATSVDEPLKTQTGRDRFGLVQPMVFESEGKKYLLDIRFRMLQPHELARAMSFPKKYRFHGSREQVVKQIGNAVPIELAAALCATALTNGGAQP